MKIVLSTDWHLKFISPFDRVTETGTPSRLQEILDSIDWVIDIGKKHKATYFLGLGDIFDSSERLQTKEGLAILQAFKRISTTFPNRSIFIPGNHDQISASQNILDFFTPSVKVFSSPGIVDIQGARLFFLPYTREKEDVYSKLDEFLTKFDTPSKKYLFGHFWDSAVMSVDPEAVSLNEKYLAFFDRVFLGHFHVPTTDINAKLVYLGTLLNKRFNESGKKGCWILDTEANTLVFHENPHSPEFFNVSDDYVLHNAENLTANAYYKVSCDPLNVLAVTKLLTTVKGFELLNKDTATQSTANINIMSVEKKNTSSLKEYILNNCDIFLPKGVSLEEFKAKGSSYMAGL